MSRCSAPAGLFCRALTCMNLLTRSAELRLRMAMRYRVLVGLSMMVGVLAVVESTFAIALVVLSLFSRSVLAAAQLSLDVRVAQSSSHSVRNCTHLRPYRAAFACFPVDVAPSCPCQYVFSRSEDGHTQRPSPALPSYPSLQTCASQCLTQPQVSINSFLSPVRAADCRST